MLYTADFETTTDIQDCRVWATGICSIDDLTFTYGNSIEYFIDFARVHIGSTFYFHNLKFDGEFIMCWLFSHGFKHITNRKEGRKNTFTTLISDKGQFYSLEVFFEQKETVKIYD